VFTGLYGDDFRQLPHDAKEERRQLVEHSLAAGSTPLVYSSMNPEVLKGVSLIQDGLLYEAPAIPAEKSVDYWSLYDLRQVPPWTDCSRFAGPDYRTRALTPFYAYQRAVEEGQRHHWNLARAFILSAVTSGADVLWLRPNASYMAHHWAYDALQSGDVATASGLYQLLIAWDPKDATAWSNLGSVRQREGDVPGAVAAHRKAVQLAPGQALFHFNLAATLWQQQSWSEVLSELTIVLHLNPQYPGIGAFYQKALQQSRLSSHS
jgi:tetratricopeptide (TPR) repeat protein